MRNFLFFVLYLISLNSFAEGVYVHPLDPPDETDLKVAELYSEEFELINFDKHNNEYIGSKMTYGFQPEPLYVSTKDKLVEAEGIVHLYYVVDASGSIKAPKAHVIEGCPCLAMYLKHQITMFEFKSAMLNGKNVSTVAMTPFEFKRKIIDNRNAKQ